MRQIWSAEEEQKLINLYPDSSASELVVVFSRSISKICSKANKLGLKKSADFFNGPFSGRLNGVVGENTRFKKNQPGWNKGKKQTDYMRPEMIERTKNTRFKKGDDPHNTVSIGSTRITKDGYVEIKIRHDKTHKNKNFVLLQRLIYENNISPIPEGYIVEFIDNNPLNFELNNLRLVTRKENMIKNSLSDKSIVKRFFGIKEEKSIDIIISSIPEVIALKRNAILLNHQINKNYAK